MIELMILIGLAVFALTYRFNNGENIYRFLVTQASSVYDKYALNAKKLVNSFIISQKA